MPITRVGPKHQVTIPKEIFDALHIEVGDYLDVQAVADRIVMVPKKLIPKDQEWFHTKEWQEKERKADEAIARGEVSKPFGTVDELMAPRRLGAKHRAAKRGLDIHFRIGYGRASGLPWGEGFGKGDFIVEPMGRAHKGGRKVR
jgi:AbrB family looped-hinge helix DNA binding protein